MLLSYLILIIVTSTLADPSSKYREKLVERSTWSRYVNRKPTDLPIKPARLVIVAHTVTVLCNSEEGCVRTLRSAEEWQVAVGFDMIGYNFMIGGDGKIYEGRGWGKLGAVANHFNCAALSVAFIGNFEVDAVSEVMIEAFNTLIEEGVRQSALAAGYKLFAHNQLSITKSPGKHILERIGSWPHSAQLSEEDNVCTSHNAEQ